MPLKTWKNHPQKLLIIGPQFFFQYCQPAQNQPKSHFLFHKFVATSIHIMTLILQYLVISFKSVNINYILIICSAIFQQLWISTFNCSIFFKTVSRSSLCNSMSIEEKVSLLDKSKWSSTNGWSTLLWLFEAKQSCKTYWHLFAIKTKIWKLIVQNFVE